MKTCFKCLITKDISEFYRHKSMSDGHLNKCKDCSRKEARENRIKNIEYYKEYDAWRFKNDPRVKERHKRYKKTKEFKESATRSKYKWIKNNPEKRAAHVVLGNAVKYGKINKPNECSVCKEITKSRRLHAHHKDYTKPLDVT